MDRALVHLSCWLSRRVDGDCIHEFLPDHVPHSPRNSLFLSCFAADSPHLRSLSVEQTTTSLRYTVSCILIRWWRPRVGVLGVEYWQSYQNGLALTFKCPLLFICPGSHICCKILIYALLVDTYPLTPTKPRSILTAALAIHCQDISCLLY